MSIVSSARATLPIFGGATYSSSSNTGATPFAPATPGHSAAEGYAAGSATTSDPSVRADATPMLGYRWDAFGTVQRLGNTPVGQAFGVSGNRNVTAIAPDGAAIGYSSDDSSDFSFPGQQPGPGFTGTYWDTANAGTSLIPLPRPPFSGSVAEGSQAFGINRSHAIVGSSSTNSFIAGGGYTPGPFVAVRWDSPTAAPVLLSTPSAGGASQASFINDAGNIAGTYEAGTRTTDLGPRPIRWVPGSTTAVALDYFPADTTGHSNTIIAGQNATGTIVGGSERGSTTVSGSTRVMSAVRWDVGNTNVTALNDLSGDSTKHVNSQAYGVNDAGTIIGYSALGFGAFGSGDRPVRWIAGGTAATELPTLGISQSGAASARGLAINGSNVAVGYSTRYNFKGVLLGQSAVVWTDDQTVTDLNDLLPTNSGWHLTSATDITTAGFISGYGTYDPPGADAAYQRGFLMLVPAAGTYGIGDADFDGHVGFSDLLVLAKHYGQSNPTQAVNVADLDLNGITDFSDLLTLAKHFSTSGAAADEATLPEAVAADWMLAQSLVPEPTMVTAALMVAVQMRRSRAGDARSPRERVHCRA